MKKYKEVARSALLDACERLDNSPHEDARRIVRDVRQALVTGVAQGTARSWFEARNGWAVDTVQVSGYDAEGQPKVWAPVNRAINAQRSGYVTLHRDPEDTMGSRRDYAGLRVVAATSRVLIVDNSIETIAYVLRSARRIS